MDGQIVESHAPKSDAPKSQVKSDAPKQGKNKMGHCDKVAAALRQSAKFCAPKSQVKSESQEEPDAPKSQVKFESDAPKSQVKSQVKSDAPKSLGKSESQEEPDAPERTLPSGFKVKLKSPGSAIPEAPKRASDEHPFQKLAAKAKAIRDGTYGD